MTKWKDKSKRYDDPEIVGSEIRFGDYKLSIHRHIHHQKDVWLTSCAHLFSTIELASKDINEAKCQAKAKLQVILETALNELLES